MIGDLPHKKKVEAHDVVGLEALSSSEEMATEEAVEKEDLLAIKIPTSEIFFISEEEQKMVGYQQ